MRKFIYFIMIFAIVSCSKDDLEQISNPGFIEGHLKNNPLLEISSKNEPYKPFYDEDFGVYRGYYITPSKDIKIKEIGFRAPEKGIHKIILSNGALYDFSNGVHIYTDSISVTDVSKFQFKEVNEDINLTAGLSYLLVYFSKNPEEYYTAEYSFSDFNDHEYLKIPLTINDIEISGLFYYYGTLSSDGSFYLEKGSEYWGGIFELWGLVDFKYELVE